VVARVHASGASLAFAAPEDLLFTATEVNEWAWNKALEETVDAVYPRFFAPGHAAVWDETSATATLQATSIVEARPELMTLLREARSRNLPAFLDEAILSVGAGAGHQAWPLDALPALGGVPWERLHDIPTALVTGSNGKTTSVRLLAAMATAHGWTTGHTCTDGIYVADELVESGDYSGPGGARSVLRDGRVGAAILETARGGILRRGLAVRQADVVLVTNVSPDHFGEYGIHSLADLTDAKLVVARAVETGGLLVLNADDAQLAARASRLKCPLGWFSLNDGHPLLSAHRSSGGGTCGIRGDRMNLHWKGEVYDLGDVACMPLSASGNAIYNIANLAGAALAAAALGIGPATIATVLATFGTSRMDNPGRLGTWRFGGITVLMDYAHNPEGLEGLMKVAMSARGTGRLGLLLGQAGNREDTIIRSLAAMAAEFNPDLVVLKDLDGYLRGRDAGEVPEILREALLAQGIPSERIRTVLPEADAACEILDWARAGDVVVLPVHGEAARKNVIEYLDSRSGPLPPARR